jgi:hypothetical protein
MIKSVRRKSESIVMAQSTAANSKVRNRTDAAGVTRFKSLRAQHALSTLGAKGVLGKGRSTKVSARLDPGLLEAARAKLGTRSDTELLTAALAIVAGDDDFGAWLVARGERLPADFELEF